MVSRRMHQPLLYIVDNLTADSSVGTYCCGRSFPYIDLEVFVRALVDSGSQSTIISRPLLHTEIEK